MLILTFVLGCGSPSLKEKGDGWESDLRDIAIQFVTDATEYGVGAGRLGRIAVMKRDDSKLDLDTEEPLAGICIVKSIEHTRRWRGEIYIRENLRGYTLWMVMYHELTHCMYKLDHWGEYGEIQHPIVGRVYSWEDAKEKHFTRLKEILDERGYELISR